MTRIDSLKLTIPRVNDRKFSPILFESYHRNEKASEILDYEFENIFQNTVLTNGHSRFKSTNSIERSNQEVRRREKVVRIFPIPILPLD